VTLTGPGFQHLRIQDACMEFGLPGVCEAQSSKSAVTWYQSAGGLRVAGFGKGGDSGVGFAHPEQVAFFGDVLGDHCSTVG